MGAKQIGPELRNRPAVVYEQVAVVPQAFRIGLALQDFAIGFGDDFVGIDRARFLAASDMTAHLLLGERRGWPGVPHIDTLVRDLREEFTHHRHRQRRRREVAELTRVLRVHQAARQAGGELLDHVVGAHRLEGRGA